MHNNSRRSNSNNLYMINQLIKCFLRNKKKRREAKLKSLTRLAFKNCFQDNCINGSWFKENQKSICCLLSICCGENEKLLKTNSFETIHNSSPLIQESIC